MLYKVRGMEFEVRGLTRGELRKFKDEGIDLDAVVQMEDEEEREKVMDRIVLTCAPDAPLDDLTPAEAAELYFQVPKLTFIGEGEIKKYKESREDGSGAVSAAPSNAPPAEGPGFKSSEDAPKSEPTGETPSTDGTAASTGTARGDTTT